MRQTARASAIPFLWRPFPLCVLLGVIMFLFHAYHSYHSIELWKERTSRIVAQTLQDLADSNLRQLYAFLSQKLSVLEAWSTLYFIPENIETKDVDNVLSLGLFDLKRKEGFLELSCLTSAGIPIASSERSIRSTSVIQVPPGEGFPPLATRSRMAVELEGQSAFLVETPVRSMAANPSDRVTKKGVIGALRGVLLWEEISACAFALTGRTGLRSGLQNESPTHFVLFQSDGTILASSLPKRPKTLKAAALDRIGLSRADERPTVFVTIGGVEYVGATSASQVFTLSERERWHPTLRLANLGLVLLRDSRQTFGELQSLARHELGQSIVAISLMVAGLFGILIWRFVRPVMRFVSFAQTVCQGHTDQRIESHVGGEFVILAAALNEMLEAIQRNALAESNAQVQAARLKEAESRLIEQQTLQRTIQDQVRVIEQIAAGDLRVRLSEDGAKEMVVMGHELNRTIERISQVVAEMRHAVVKLGIVTGEILATTSLQTENFRLESRALQTTGSAVQKLKEAAADLGAQAQKVATCAESSARVFDTGELSLNQVVLAIEDLSKTTRTSSQCMQDLTVQLDRIDQILTTVTDISEQSKLLSLNAAIEAARARQSGKGFGVVAVEIRNLAVQSREAASQIKDILKGIRSASQSMYEELGRTVEKALHAAQLTQTVRAIRRQLKTALDESSSLTVTVKGSSAEQYRNMEQIATSMAENISRMERNIEGAREIEETLRELRLLAQSLDETSAMFKV